MHDLVEIARGAGWRAESIATCDLLSHLNGCCMKKQLTALENKPSDEKKKKRRLRCFLAKISSSQHHVCNYPKCVLLKTVLKNLSSLQSYVIFLTLSVVIFM